MSLFFLRILTLWLHLASVTIWIGGILFFLFAFGPAVHSLPPSFAIQSLNKGRQLLQRLSWIAIYLALITGTVNFFLLGHATGWAFRTGYTRILVIKLLLFLAMLVHHVLQSWKYAPQLNALTVQAPPDIQTWPEPLLSHWKKWFVLLKVNAVLGLIVLLLGLALNRNWM